MLCSRYFIFVTHLRLYYNTSGYTMFIATIGDKQQKKKKEVYRVNLRVPSDCAKIRTRETLNTDTFYAVKILKLLMRSEA